MPETHSSSNKPDTVATRVAEQVSRSQPKGVSLLRFPVCRYALAIVLSLAAILLRYSIEGWTGSGGPMPIFFVIPIIFSAYVGGLGPGLLSTLIAAIGTDYWFIQPVNSLAMARPVDQLQWILLIASGAVITMLVEALHRSQRKVEASLADLIQYQEKMKEQAALLDQARDAIVVRDLKGKVLFWNKGAERMYGWTREEAMGRNIVRLIYSDPKKFDVLNPLFLNRGEWFGELQLLTKDRDALTIEARWTLLRDKEGCPKSVLAIDTDVTEKKKIEAQFMRAQRMESIGTLAGGIAHDLNNILAPIMMSIEILKQTATDPQALKILDTIGVSSRRGADIVRQVLSFARGLEGDRAAVQPDDLLKDIEAIIRDTFPKNIQLKLSLPDDTWEIFGDRTQLHQILLNLCLNARDAMPRGGSLAIHVENAVFEAPCAALHLEARAGRYVIIKVTDSGTGIPPAVIDKIFEPFFTTKEVGKGTGIGLSTVLAIVKSHAGLINVESEPGLGTTFKVCLPAMEATSGARKVVEEFNGLPRGNGETVLIVDDEASVLAVTGQTLETFGYRTLTANDGAEALTVYVLHRDEISAMLCDMVMPVMDGPATIRAIRKINPVVKVIAASGSGTSGSRAKEADSEIKYFLPKPYTAGTLLKTLRTILDEP
ncbi:MAG: ATP-binding protein [Methylacidiphilales bacterium]|nr:ATP-binding protein [Candidatus Methylacidiphilales bacterium]